MSDETGYITQEREDDLAAAVNTLDAEVVAAVAKEAVTQAGKSATPISDFYLIRWFPVVRDVRAWQLAHTGFFGRFDDAGFVDLTERFNRARAEWVGPLHQGTASTSVGSSDANEGAVLASVGGGLGDIGGKLLLAAGVVGAGLLLLKVSDKGSRK